MSFKVLKYAGSFFIFMGLMLIMAPHFIYHIHPDGANSDGLENSPEHIYLFTLPGMIPTLLGVYLLNQYDKKSASKTKKQTPVCPVYRR